MEPPYNQQLGQHNHPRSELQRDSWNLDFVNFFYLNYIVLEIVTTVRESSRLSQMVVFNLNDSIWKCAYVGKKAIFAQIFNTFSEIASCCYFEPQNFNLLGNSQTHFPSRVKSRPLEFVVFISE